MTGSARAGEPTLAIDIGGTKILVALVSNGRLLGSRQLLTDRNAGGDAWCDAIAEAALPWRGHYKVAGAAVTGAIDKGRWYALDPETLPISPGYPLCERLGDRLGVPVVCQNDAQAAAWGEFRFGSGRGADMVFVTISTGVGAGVVLGGRLTNEGAGSPGSLGFAQALEDGEITPTKAFGSGRWMALRAGDRAADARDVFAAAHAGADWAHEIISLSLDRMARLLRGVQRVLDPDVLVIGGGIGLAPGYFEGLTQRLECGQRTSFRRAHLGLYAGVAGTADLALATLTDKETVDEQR